MRKLIVTISVAIMTVLCSSAPLPAQGAPQRFTVTTQGKGPDVILIPGLASPRDVYAHEAALLAPHYRVHLVQVNGFGTQPAGVNASGPLLEPIVAELHGYIATHHLEHPAVAGHSLGGLLALMLAAEHPADAGRVLVVDSLPFVALMFRPDSTVTAVEPIAAKMRDTMLHESEEQYAAGEQTTMARLVRDPEQRKIATTWVSASDHSVVAEAMYDDFTTDLRPELGKIKVPVTVLYPFDAVMGTQDKVHALYAQAFAGLPQAKLVQINGSYHFIMLDQPQAFHQAMVEFLK